MYLSYTSIKEIKEKIKRLILQLYASGISPADISKYLRKNKIAYTRPLVQYYVDKYKGEIIKGQEKELK